MTEVTAHSDSAGLHHGTAQSGYGATEPDPPLDAQEGIQGAEEGWLEGGVNSWAEGQEGSTQASRIAAPPANALLPPKSPSRGSRVHGKGHGSEDDGATEDRQRTSVEASYFPNRSGVRKLASCPFVSLGSAFFFLMRMICAFWLLFSRCYLQHNPLLLRSLSPCVAMQYRTID